jgi:protein translocase SEC61 complex gamma subunit
MGLGRILANTARTLKLTRKSDREEFTLYLKLVFIGFGLVGAIGFVVYFLASMILLAAGVHGVNPSGNSAP